MTRTALCFVVLQDLFVQVTSSCKRFYSSYSSLNSGGAGTSLCRGPANMASGEDKRAAAAGPAGPNGAAAQPGNLPTLRSVCLHALIVNRRFLGDVGDIDGTSVRDIVRHCSAQEMANIEDCTRCAGSRGAAAAHATHAYLPCMPRLALQLPMLHRPCES